MRAVRVLTTALGLGLLSSSACAQPASPPPAYTVNVVVETAKGEAVYKDTLNCDPTKRCDGQVKEIIVAGTPRLFALSLRWDGAQLDYECLFKPITEGEKKAMRLLNRPSGKIPLRDKQTKEEPLYDTRNGVADRVQFGKGPVAKVRFEVKL